MSTTPNTATPELTDRDRNVLANVLRSLLWALEWAERSDRFQAGVSVGHAQGWTYDVSREAKAFIDVLIDLVKTACRASHPKRHVQNAREHLERYAADHGLTVKRSAHGSVIGVDVPE